ncbi:MAG: MFS transporter [Caldilineaceae bacterium]|nr:MFS transporter [Caldilineaceae bacterium]
MKTFLVIWFGQCVSQIGTALTRFALLIWVYQQHHRAMDVALLGFFTFLPSLLASPVAGVWVDRMDRRKVMLWADAGAGLMTACLLALFANDQLQVWHLYAAQLLAGLSESFQSPAYAATTTLLVNKADYGRINGLRSLAHYGALVIAPFLAGFLVVWLGLGGILLLDLATFLVAVVTLLSVSLPRLDAAGVASVGSSPWQDLRAGLAYIQVRPGLIGLMLLHTATNFIVALTYYSTLPTLILARSGGNEVALAVVQATLGGAGVIGGVIVSLWGGPRRKIHGVLLGAGFSFLWGDLWFGLGRTLPHWVIGASVAVLVIPLIDSSNMAILQAKVAPAMQGRFFALFHMARQSLMPVGYLLAGLLADQWLEPAMAPTGALAPRLGWLVGVGPGAGIALMFVGAALLGSTVCGAAYLFPAVRNIEDELADHDVRAPSAPGGEALAQMS